MVCLEVLARRKEKNSSSTAQVCKVTSEMAANTETLSLTETKVEMFDHNSLFRVMFRKSEIAKHITPHDLRQQSRMVE